MEKFIALFIIILIAFVITIVTYFWDKSLREKKEDSAKKILMSEEEYYKIPDNTKHHYIAGVDPAIPDSPITIHQTDPTVYPDLKDPHYEEKMDLARAARVKEMEEEMQRKIKEREEADKKAEELRKLKQAEEDEFRLLQRESEIIKADLKKYLY